MARTVSVKLTADASGLVAAFAQGAAAAQAFAAKASSAVSKNEQGINNLSRTAGLLGLAAAAGVGLAVKAFADFDSAMSGVAATGSDARASLTSLREAAIQAGADTKYSATEAAGGIEALAKAGVSANDILGGGLTGALNLAAAGNLGVAGSAEAAASAMNQFGLAGADIPHIADLLAQAAGTAQGEVSDMAAALNQAGSVAADAGLTIDDTAQALALFASQGLTGSDAGTSFKNMLLSLTPSSKEAAVAMEQIGLNAYDAQGQFIGFRAVADQLKKGLSGLSDAQRQSTLQTIFGRDAIRSVNALYPEGAAGLERMATEFGNFGSASDVAAIKMDNLRGDLELFRGSFETAMIGLGEGGDGPLRDLTQGATDAVNAFNDLGSGTKSALLVTAAGLAAVALGAAGLGKLVVGANAAKVALDGLHISAKVAGIATLGITAAVGIAAFAYSRYAENAAVARQKVEDFSAALEGQTAAINQNTIAVATKSLEDSGALKAAQDYGLSLETVTQAALGNADAQTIVRDRLAQVKAEMDLAAAAGGGAETSTRAQVDAYNALRDGVFGTSEAFDKAIASTQRMEEASAGAAAAAKADPYTEAAAALGQIGASAGSAATSLQDLAAALFDASNAALASSNAAVGYEQAVDAAAAAAEKNGKNLKIGTEAGRENRTALNNLAAASQKYVQSLVEQGKGASDVAAATKDARSAFIDSAVAMGKTKGEAADLADQYGLIPKKVKTDVEANTGKSEANLALVKNAIKGLPKKVQAQIIAEYKKGGVEAAKAALATLKNKTVTAGTKADTKGVINVNAALRAMKGKTVTAGTRPDLSGAEKVDRFVRGMQGKTVTAGTRADTSGASAAQRAVNSVTGKTVYVNVVQRVSRQVAPGTKNMPAAYGGSIPGYSPHDRADNILVAATAGEFMHDVPAVRYWGDDFMHAVLRRDQAAVAALAAQPRAYGGPIVPQYASTAMNYALASGQGGGHSGPRVHAPIAITMPAAADPMAAASGAGGRVATILSAIGV